MILIAESKTMRSELYSLSSLHGSEPQFETEAREIMDSVAAMSPAEVAAMLHCSGRLALTAVEQAKSFSHSTLGIKTLEAFHQASSFVRSTPLPYRRKPLNTASRN